MTTKQNKKLMLLGAMFSKEMVSNDYNFIEGDGFLELRIKEITFPFFDYRFEEVIGTYLISAKKDSITVHNWKDGT